MDFNSVLTIGFFLLFIIALFLKNSNSSLLDKIINNKKYYYIIAFIFLIGAFVRMFKFGEIPAGINQDGAMAAVDAYALANYGTDRFLMPFPAHFTAWGFGQMSVLLSYLMVPFIKLFGLSIFAVRLPILIVSIIAMIVLFLLLEKVFDKKVALIGMFILAINPWHIMQSRWALDCNLFPHFLLFSIFFLYLGLKKSPYLYLSMVFFGLTMYTYGIAFYSVPILLIVLSIYILLKKLIPVKRFIICVATYLIVSAPIILVILVNTFKLKTFKLLFFTIPYFSQTIRTNDLLPFAKDIGKQLTENFNSLINVAFFQKPDLPWNSIEGFGPLYLFSLPLIIAGLFLIFRKTKKENTSYGKFFIIAWLFVGIFSGLMVNDVNINRVNLIFYPLIILISLGLYYILFNKMPHKILAVTILVVFLGSFSLFCNSYFGEHSKVLAENYFNGFGESIEYAESLNSQVIYITSNTQYEGSSNVSEILTMFYSKIDAKYFNNKKEITKDGKKLLPYSQRYQYVNFKKSDVLEEKAVFVFKLNEKDLFENKGFTKIKEFNGYGVASSN